MGYKDPQKQKEFLHKHYIENKEKYRQSNKNSLNKRKNFIRNIKLIYGCKFCNEKEICCLCFHHIKPSLKEGFVNKLIKTASLSRIKKEIEKCICVCHNCHSKIHTNLIKVRKNIKTINITPNKI